jgi:hypothetical protein
MRSSSTGLPRAVILTAAKPWPGSLLAVAMAFKKVPTWRSHCISLA